jgi:hypothetical protein
MPALALDIGRSGLPFAEGAAILLVCNHTTATRVSALLGIRHGSFLLLFDRLTAKRFQVFHNLRRPSV